MRLLLPALALLATATTASCVRTLSLTPRPLGTPAQLQATAFDERDVDAVVLRREVRYLMVNPPQRPAYFEQQRYEAIKILTEAGFEAASQHIAISEKGRLAHLEARTISTTGVVTPLDPALVVDDEVKIGNSTYKTKSFRMPRVEVGAILEITWTLHSAENHWSVQDEPVGPYPVLSYDAEIVLDRYAQPDLLLNNVSIPIGYEKAAPDGSQRITLHLENLRSHGGELHRPASRSSQPWWLYRTIAWRYPKIDVNGLSVWGRAFGALRELLVEGKGAADGPSLRPVGGADGCRSPTCLINAALAQARTDVPLSSFRRSLTPKPLAEVIAARAASNIDKAVYVWSLLNSAGLEARLAGVARNRAMVVDTFPSGEWFDHLIVHVTTSEGPVWVDPSCEHCVAGELPDWSRDCVAAVLSVGDGDYGREIKVAALEKTVGRPGAAQRRRQTYDVALEPDGDAVVTARVEVFGREATDEATDASEHTAKGAEDEAGAWVRRISAAAEVRGATPWRCDRAAGSCVFEYSSFIPGLGSIGADGSLVLATNTFPLPEGPALVADKERIMPVFVLDASMSEVEVTYRTPAGWTFQSEQRKGRGAVAGLEVEGRLEGTGDRLTLKRTARWTAGSWDRAHWKQMKAALLEASKPMADALRATPASATTAVPSAPPAEASSAASTAVAPRPDSPISTR